MMDPSRFFELVGTYGAKVDRWPAAERMAAEAWLADEPATRLTLARSLEITDRPDLSMIGSRQKLERDIVERLCARQSIARARHRWASMIGGATAAGLGVIAGLVATPSVLPARSADNRGGTAFEQTSFGRLIDESPLPRKAATT